MMARTKYILLALNGCYKALSRCTNAPVAKAHIEGEIRHYKMLLNSKRNYLRMAAKAHKAGEFIERDTYLLEAR